MLGNNDEQTFWCYGCVKFITLKRLPCQDWDLFENVWTCNTSFFYISQIIFIMGLDCHSKTSNRGFDWNEYCMVPYVKIIPPYVKTNRYVGSCGVSRKRDNFHHGVQPQIFINYSTGGHCFNQRMTHVSWLELLWSGCLQSQNWINEYMIQYRIK